MTLIYTDGVRQRGDGSAASGCTLELDGKAYGIEDDYLLTPVVARLLKLNRPLIESRISPLKEFLSYHQKHYAEQARRKEGTLSYSFLLNICGEEGLSSKALEAELHSTEQNENVRHLLDLYPAAVMATQERLICVNRSRITQRWFLVFDDLWRRNRTTMKELIDNPSAFSPHYRTSICYRPMSRPQLEQYLARYQLWNPKTRRTTFFHVGLLNSLYFMLDEVLYSGTAQAIPLRVGVAHHHAVDFHELANLTHKTCDPIKEEEECLRPSMTLTYASGDTGEGTSADEGVIRARHAFTFEQVYDVPRYKFTAGQRRARMQQLLNNVSEGIKTWLGLVPVVHSHSAPGVYMRMRISKGHLTLPRAGHRALENG